jgi:hypothetical protein
MQTRVVRTSLLFILTCCNSHLLFSEDLIPVSDPQALTLAQQSNAALTSGVVVSDVTLTGNATWIAGSDIETGQTTLQAKGIDESRMDLTLSGGARTEIRSDSSGDPQGESINADGTIHPWPSHNCWINANWFFPALSSLAATSNTSMIFTYVGLETRSSVSVQHIRVSHYFPSKSPAFTAAVQKLSTEDIYLDSASLLPVAFIFNTHPEDDQDTNILVEIDFESYQMLNGLLVPMHVKKLINGGLALDLALAGAVLNSGLTDAPFAIQ